LKAASAAEPVVAIRIAGHTIKPHDALKHLWGYATGLDDGTFSSTHEKRGALGTSEKMSSNPAHSAWFTPLQKSATTRAVKSGFL
jgi:hypothetical protein